MPGKVSLLPGFNGAAGSGPCPTHREWDCTSQHGLRQPRELSGCWRLWSPARTPAHSCQEWETLHSPSDSPDGASRAAERPGLVLPWVDPRRSSWPGPAACLQGTRAPFWRMNGLSVCGPLRDPAAPDRPLLGGRAGVRGTPRAWRRRAAIQGKSMALAVLKVAFVPCIPWGRR